MAAAPSPWVERFIVGVRAGGCVLDVACGAGRHVALARRAGLAATGVDRDITAARAAFAGDARVALIEADLEAAGGAAPPLAPGAFDGVIVTNYLWRPLLPLVVAAVGPAGILIYETFRAGNERFGRPSNPAFLLEPGELLDAVAGRLTVVAYEEACLDAPTRVVARVCAVGAGHPWVALPPRL